MAAVPDDPSHAQAVGWVLYDATCGICSRWVPWWSPSLGRLGLGTAALQEPWVAGRVDLPADELLRDICILFADGRLVRGADAYRWILRRRWWTWPLWLVAAVPPTSWLFAWAYRTFARNRHAVSQACGIRPSPVPAGGRSAAAGDPTPRRPGRAGAASSP